MKLGVHESPRSHNSLIRRIDETGETAGQIDVLVGRQGQPVLLEPDGDLVRRATSGPELLQADRTGVDTQDRVRTLEVFRSHVDGLVATALAIQAGDTAAFCDAE